MAKVQRDNDRIPQCLEISLFPACIRLHVFQESIGADQAPARCQIQPACTRPAVGSRRSRFLINSEELRQCLGGCNSHRSILSGSAMRPVVHLS